MPAVTKRKLRQGYPVHTLDLYLLAKAYPPQLGIIDGYLGMDGDGPVTGDPVEWGVAIASTDPVAADCLAAQLMGLHITDIGYLWYLQEKGLGVCDVKDMGSSVQLQGMLPAVPGRILFIMSRKNGGMRRLIR